MEIKEVTSEEAVELEKAGEKVLKKSDKIFDAAKENLTPAHANKVRKNL